MNIGVDSLEFMFPEGWIATKFDDWSFYKKQFAKMHDGIKAVDIIAIDPQKTVWLVEAKDYRTHSRNKTIPIIEEIWQKVFATLAALLPAKVNASPDGESNFAAKILGAKGLRVVFHCEQPRTHSKLYPQSINLADVQQKFKSAFKAIDPHALVVSRDIMPRSIQWTVV